MSEPGKEKPVHPDRPLEATRSERDRGIFAADILAGLSTPEKYIPAEYHYDVEGSRLFREITELPEYYLTRCEIDVLERNKEWIADTLADRPNNIIEFGPGDGSKTRTLLEYFISRQLDLRYVAVDISADAVVQLATDFKVHLPQLPVDCVITNYLTGMKWLNKDHQRRNVVMFLGSSIGNFNPDQAMSFGLRMRRCLNEGDTLIIGFDLVKEPELIHKAYNDARNVTAMFNLNILLRINRELDGVFDISKFSYLGRYLGDDRVVQSYLRSKEAQNVRIGALNRSFYFYPGEFIHTEDSYKYRESDIESLAAACGFDVKAHLYDARKYFVDSVWVVPKS